ncbi:hypothetical protein FALBO_192, partial [Fusarium albosuccineum]
PTSNPDPENNEDDKDDNSTKEDEKSTAESTTEEPTTTTTSEECSATTQPDCTRTISYITSAGTEVITEFGDCPTVVSCATGTQATETVTLSPDLVWAGEIDDDPIEDIPDDADTAAVDKDLIIALEDYWEEYFENEDDVTGTSSTVESTTTDTATESTGTTSDETTTTDTATTETATTESTETSTKESTSQTTTTTESIPTSTASTLLTTTRESSDTSMTITSTSDQSTTTEETRTYFPCFVRGGPRISSAYCQCETTVSGKQYLATTTLIDGQCAEYTEFPSTINPATEAPPVTEAPIMEPVTQTQGGTVLAYSSYSLEYFGVGDGIKVTVTRGLGEAATLSTPVPTQTAVDNDGSGQCGTSDGLSKSGLGDACDRAINEFDDNTIYKDYATRYSRSTKGILMVASMGQAACIAKFECDDYGIGMSGKDIKQARENAKANDNIWMCGHISLSNSCRVVMDYCTNSVLVNMESMNTLNCALAL